MIRKATAEDASRLAEILIFAKRMAYSDIFNDYKISFWSMQVLPLALNFQKRPETLNGLYVCEEEVIKGLIRLSFDAENARMEICELYVDPFFQRRHIGDKLIDFARTRARESGNKQIFLWVLEKNKAARAFYEKHGFQYASEKQLEEGTPEYLLKYQLFINAKTE